MNYKINYLNNYHKSIFKKYKNEFTSFLSLFWRDDWSDDRKTKLIHGVSLLCSKCNKEFEDKEELIYHSGFNMCLHKECFKILKKEVVQKHDDIKTKEIELFWDIYFKRKNLDEETGGII